MNLLKLIPDWAYWVAIAALAAAVGVQQVRVANLKADVAQVEKARDGETAARERAAREHADKLRDLQARHAEEQQQKETDYETKLAKLEKDKRADAAVAGQLRDKLAAFAARSQQPGETDTAAVERYANRLGIVSGLLAESIDLVTEGRSVIERRDAEVGRLLEQINLDRSACQAGDKGSSKP